LYGACEFSEGGGGEKVANGGGSAEAKEDYTPATKITKGIEQHRFRVGQAQAKNPHPPSLIHRQQAEALRLTTTCAGLSHHLIATSLLQVSEDVEGQELHH
jgi:hypothetical protein